MKNLKFRVYDYDVWGNKTDGYDVNSVFHTSCVVSIPDTNKNYKYNVVKALVDANYLVPKALESLMTLDVRWDEPETIYIDYSDMPYCELRLEGK